MSYRTHTCGELRLMDAGKKVRLAGWMENVREVGAGLAFLVLRDFYGTTQVVLESEELVRQVREIHKESTIQVDGVGNRRHRGGAGGRRHSGAGSLPFPGTSF